MTTKIDPKNLVLVRGSSLQADHTYHLTDAKPGTFLHDERGPVSRIPQENDLIFAITALNEQGRPMPHPFGYVVGVDTAEAFFLYAQKPCRFMARKTINT